jgi:sortase A
MGGHEIIGYNHTGKNIPPQEISLARRRTADQLSTEELRQLLIERRREEHEARLEAYRRTGRVIRVDEPRAAGISPTQEEDELTGLEITPARRRRNRRKSGLDTFLFAVEIVAIVGLLFIFFNGVSLIRDLNREVASALQQPTVTPTPLITAVVLPSGHKPPVAGQEVQPNTAEIPEHLRPLMQSYANLPVPTAGPQQATRMQIPTINVDAPVVQGDGWEQLKKGIGQHIGSADPGNKGNLVVSAHNDVFGQLFKDLDQLKPGDTVVVFTADRSFTYVVSGTRVVDPTEVSVMDATENASLTLISCYPYLVDNKRIVVTAVLKDS